MSKCPHCNKTVYFAERQMYNGREYHQTCVWTLTKEEEKKRGQPLFSVSEAMFANPHEANTTGGQEAALKAPKSQASGSSMKKN